MASEKADLSHQDTESLPPQYASSESAFSDSPPPAYRKTNTVRLQVTRIVCATVLLSGFLTGFFILAHSWINARDACHCPEAYQPLPAAGRLVQAGVLPDVTIQDIAPKMSDVANEVESRQVDIPLPFEEEEVKEDLAIAEKVLEEEANELQDIEEEKEGKKVRLPVGMLLGNPALAGKDVQCKVQQKVTNLGGGLLSKTIMVTCDDDSAEEPAPLPSSRPTPPRPPMSLLAPILKMMAARANARLQRMSQQQPDLNPMSHMSQSPEMIPMSQRNQPKLVLRRFPQFPHGIKGPIRFSSAPQSPFSAPQNPFSAPQRAFRRPVFAPHSPERFEAHREEEEPRNMLFREDFDREEEPQEPQGPIVFRRFPAPQPQRPEEHEEMRIRHDSPVKVIRGFPPQIPDAIKEIVSKIINDGAEDEEKTPVIAIRAIPQTRAFDIPSERKLMLPFPFAALKPQGRAGRKLSFPDDSGDFPETSQRFPEDFSGQEDGAAVPAGAGRALDSPVTIPSPAQRRFLPGLVRVPLPLPLPEGRAITHMEMKEIPTNEIPIESEDYEEEHQQDQKQEDHEQDHQQSQQQDQEHSVVSLPGDHFGPPRDHTVIEDPLKPQHLLGFPDEMPSFLRHLPLPASQMPPTSLHMSPPAAHMPPPPPTYAREGRVGVIQEVNADAELLPQEPPQHHRLSVL